MPELRLKTSINLNGLDKIKNLINEQQKLLENLRENVLEIENAERELYLEISMGKATQE